MIGSFLSTTVLDLLGGDDSETAGRRLLTVGVLAGQARLFSLLGGSALMLGGYLGGHVTPVLLLRDGPDRLGPSRSGDGATTGHTRYASARG